MTVLATAAVIYVLLFHYGEGTRIETILHSPTSFNGTAEVCSDDTVFVECFAERSGNIRWVLNPSLASFEASINDPAIYLDSNNPVNILLTRISKDTDNIENSNLSSILWFKVDEVFVNEMAILTLTCMDNLGRSSDMETLIKPESPPKFHIVNTFGATYDGKVYLFVEWTFSKSTNNNNTYQVQVDWMDNNIIIITEFVNGNNNASITIKQMDESVTDRYQVHLKTKNICNETIDNITRQISVENITEEVINDLPTPSTSGTTSTNEQVSEENSGGDESCNDVCVAVILSVSFSLPVGVILSLIGGIIVFCLCRKKTKVINQSIETEMEGKLT